MQNFFDPSMAIGGAAISFFLAWNFGLKFFFGNQFCEKNWLYALLEPCFLQKIRQNGQKVTFEILLKFSKNSIFLLKTWKTDVLD